MRASSGTQDNEVAVTPSVLHILFALADGQLHGYAIMREVERISEGKVRMGPGTLYGAVKKLLLSGWIEEVEGRRGSGKDDERRRYYRLTGLGTRVLNSEVSRMRALVRLARGKKLISASVATA